MRSAPPIIDDVTNSSSGCEIESSGDSGVEMHFRPLIKYFTLYLSFSEIKVSVNSSSQPDLHRVPPSDKMKKSLLKIIL